MLWPSQDDPCGRRRGGGDDGAEDAGYATRAAAAVLEGLTRRHRVASTAFSSAAPEVLQSSARVEAMVQSITADAAMAIKTQLAHRCARGREPKQFWSRIIAS